MVNKQQVTSSRRFKKSYTIDLLGSITLNTFFLRKRLFIRKGLFLRKLIVRSFNVGSKSGEYAVSRYVFNRLPKKRR